MYFFSNQRCLYYTAICHYLKSGDNFTFDKDNNGLFNMSMHDHQLLSGQSFLLEGKNQGFTLDSSCVFHLHCLKNMVTKSGFQFQ